MTEEEIATEKQNTSLYTRMADMIVESEPTPENVAAAMIATAHVLVAVGFTAFPTKEQAINMISESIIKAMVRREYALEHRPPKESTIPFKGQHKEGQTKNEKKENQEAS